MMTNVGELREKIDAIDLQLLDLLNRRAEVSVALGRRKREAGVGLRDPAREEEIVARARSRTSGPLDPQAVERLFRAILAESRHAQSRHPSAVDGSGRLQCA